MKAVVHMSNADDEWEDTRDGKLRKLHPFGFMVIKPVNDESYVPFECPVCDQTMRFATDPHAYAKYKCCSTCATMWAEGHRDEWEEGWRPDPDVVAAHVATLSGKTTRTDAT